MSPRRPPQEDPPGRRELRKGGGPPDNERLVRNLRIAVMVLLVPAAVLSGFYIYAAYHPPEGRDARDVLSNGAPVFFITLVMLWLVVNPPGGRK